MDQDNGESYAEYVLIEYSVKVGDETYTASRSITEGDDSTFAYQQLKDVVCKQVDSDYLEYKELCAQRAIANLAADQAYFAQQRADQEKARELMENSRHFTVEQALRDVEGMEDYE